MFEFMLNSLVKLQAGVCLFAWNWEERLEPHVKPLLVQAKARQQSLNTASNIKIESTRKHQ